MDFDVCIVTDQRDQRWVVRAPRRTAAAVTLDTELRLLPLLGRQLPVPVPQPAGCATLPEGGQCVVYPFLPGAPMGSADLVGRSALAVQVGQLIGVLHEIDPQSLDDAGLASYTAEQYRQRRRTDVERAAATGYVPAGLLVRWERALEPGVLWQFQETVTHGDLAQEHVLVADGVVSGVIDWGEACVADPADDLAWVLLCADEDAVDTVFEAYAMARQNAPDPHLMDRARLAGELALARWLLGGVAADDASVVDRAATALASLTEHCGQIALDR